MKQFKTTEVIDEWTNAQTLFDKNYLVHNDIPKLSWKLTEYKNQGGQDRVDQTAGGATEAEDGENQEGDDAAERQARRPESQRCEDDLFLCKRVKT